MIVIESKRKNLSTLKNKYPDAAIIDATSHAKDDYIKLSPFYPHGGIPVPYSQGVYGKSVEGIWQGLKVFENTGISRASFENNTMKNLKRTVAKYGRVRGHQKGVFSNELLDYATARRQIYARIYRWVLDNKVQDLIAIIRKLSETNTVVLLDYNTNPNIDDTSTPLSHASLIKAYIEENYPTFESDGTQNELVEDKKKAPFEMNFKVGQHVRHHTFGEGTVTEIKGEFIKVDFNGTAKTLKLGFAKLEAVNDVEDEVESTVKSEDLKEEHDEEEHEEEYVDDVDYDSLFPSEYSCAKNIGEGCVAIQREIDGCWDIWVRDNMQIVSDFIVEVGYYREGLLAVNSFEDFWGYLDTKGEIVISCQYEEAHPFSEGLAAVKDFEDPTYKYINKNGEVVIDGGYEEVRDFHEGLAAVCREEKHGDEDRPWEYQKWGYINKKGEEVIPCQYTQAYDFEDGLAMVSINDAWGFIDKNGKEVIPCEHGDINDFQEGLCIVSPELHHPKTFVNRWNQVIIEGDEFYGHQFSEGLCAAGRSFNGSMGYINKRGQYALPGAWDTALDFHEGRAFVHVDGKWGVIDRMGEYVVEPRYDEPGRFEDGVSLIFEDGCEGIIDRDGQIVFPPIYKSVVKAGNYYHLIDQEGVWGIDWRKKESSTKSGYDKFLSCDATGLTIVRKIVNGKRFYGFIDKHGQEVIPCIYDEVNYCNPLYKVKDADGYHLFDETGKRLTTRGYDFIYDFHEGLCAVEKDLLWGFVNEQGEEVVAPRYHHAKDFSDGMCVVSMEGKYGFIDKQGNEVVPCKYEVAVDFHNGMGWVRNGEGRGYVDKSGKLAIPLTYELGLSFNSQGIVSVKKGGKAGAIDKANKIVVPFEYDYIRDFNENELCPFKKGKEYGFFNAQGQVVIDLGDKYEKVEFFHEGLCAVKSKDGWGFINEKGDEVVKCQYERNYFWDHFWGFEHGLCDVIKEGKHGLIDLTGKEIISTKFDCVYWGKGDIIITALKNKWHFFNRQGKRIKTPHSYDSLSYTDNYNKLIVVKNGLRGCINVTGAEILKCAYDKIEYWCKYKKFTLHKDGLVGVASEVGVTIIPIQYKNIHLYEDRMVAINTDGNLECIDYKGNIII